MDLFNNEVGLNIGDEAGFFASDEELSNLVYQTHLEGNLLYLNPIDYSGYPIPGSPFWDNPLTPELGDGHHGISTFTNLIPTNEWKN